MVNTLDEQKLTKTLIEIYQRFLINPQDKMNHNLAGSVYSEYENLINQGFLKKEIIEAMSELYRVDLTIMTIKEDQMTNEEAIRIIEKLKSIRW
jgi:hypothetical protein